MIELDGSQGEGGGQILRTALGLSMVSGRAFRIEKIRAGRPKPGLLRQHLTAVRAAAEICDGAIDGAELGSRALTFEPRNVRAGEYAFAIGSAGSTTLVLQAILPGLLAAEGESVVTLEGGTHNPFAPPFDFLEKAFLPLVRRMGADVSLTLERAGFAPAGGGKMTVRVRPAKLAALHLPERGEIVERKFAAITAGLSADIAAREIDVARRKLGWPAECFEQVAWDEGWGPGNVIAVTVRGEHVTEVFTGFGQRGKKAEGVAESVVRDVKHHLAANVPVGECLADQLLVPMALAGAGSFVSGAPSRHTTTNADVIKAFLPVRIDFIELAKGRFEVSVGR